MHGVAGGELRGGGSDDCMPGSGGGWVGQSGEDRRRTMNIKNQLVSAATQYDQRQSRKASYNPYALGQYFARIDEVCADVEAGASPRAALCAGFHDRLLDVLLKAIGEKPHNREELPGGWAYQPIKRS